MVSGPSGMSLLRGEERRLPNVTVSILYAPFCGGVRRFRNRNDGRSLALQQCVSTTVLQSVVPDVLKHSQIDISVMITDVDGGVDCCVINATMLAIADAGAAVSFTSRALVSHCCKLACCHVIQRFAALPSVASRH